jgi:hypothetical protein
MAGLHLTPASFEEAVELVLPEHEPARLLHFSEKVSASSPQRLSRFREFGNQVALPRSERVVRAVVGAARLDVC